MMAKTVKKWYSKIKKAVLPSERLKKKVLELEAQLRLAASQRKEFVLLSVERDFPWQFTDSEREMRVRTFSEAFKVPGFKEILSHNVYVYRRRVIEAEKPDPKDVTRAEVYQDLLTKISTAHKMLEANKNPDVQEVASLEAVL